MPITAFDKGRLKIAAHVREELERARIQFQAIQCKSGGTDINRGMARLIVTVAGRPLHLDLTEHDVEECELIVAGDVWRKIGGFIAKLSSLQSSGESG